MPIRPSSSSRHSQAVFHPHEAAKVARFCWTRPDDLISAGLTWYGIPSIPDFNICSHCFHAHIANTPHRNAFSVIPHKPEIDLPCNFNTPRAMSLWRRSASIGDITPLIQYMQEMTGVVPCPFNKAVAKAEQPNIQWMTPIANRSGDPDTVEGFAVCRRCYEDFVVPTSFANYFEVCPIVQGPQDAWSCDAAVPFIQYLFQEAAKSGTTDWKLLMQSIHVRFSCSSCSGAGGTAVPVKWYTPKDTIEGMVVCESHYLDTIVALDRGTEFIPNPTPQQPGVTWTCDFSSVNILLAFGMTARLNLPSKYWRDAVSTTFSTPPCTVNGVQDGAWYNMIGVPDTDVCPICFDSYIRPFGFESHYTLAQYPPGTQRMCDHALGTARSVEYLRRLMVAGVHNDFNSFASHVKAHNQLPFCPKSGVAHNHPGVFYGTDGFLVCQECHYDVIRPSSFPAVIPQRRPRTDERCSLWYPEMRELWKQACSSGDLTAFTAAAMEKQKDHNSNDQLALQKAQWEYDRVQQTNAFLTSMNRNRYNSASGTRYVKVISGINY